MDNVISLVNRRKSKQVLYYEAKLLTLNKLELLEEMVKFQEERSELGYLNLEMIQKGIPLFKALSKCSETKEMSILVTSYFKHLEIELKNYKEIV